MALPILIVLSIKILLRLKPRHASAQSRVTSKNPVVPGANQLFDDPRMSMVGFIVLQLMFICPDREAQRGMSVVLMPITLQASAAMRTELLQLRSSG